MYPLMSGLCLRFLFISSLLSFILFSSQPLPLSVTSPISHLRLPPSCDLLSTFPDLSRPLDCGVKDRGGLFVTEKKESHQQHIVFFSSPLEGKQTAQKYSVWPELTSPSHLLIGFFFLVLEQNSPLGFAGSPYFSM